MKLQMQLYISPDPVEYDPGIHSVHVAKVVEPGNPFSNGESKEISIEDLRNRRDQSRVEGTGKVGL